MTLAVSVAPNLVSGTVYLTLLTAAPAGALVMLQFYLTAHLNYIIVLDKFDNSLSCSQHIPHMVPACWEVPLGPDAVYPT